MAKEMLKMSATEVHATIPYSLICMTRYGSSWDTGRCRRGWLSNFSEEERKAATRLFQTAHDWTVGRGVPDIVRMSTKTFFLWRKIGDFCASI